MRLVFENRAAVEGSRDGALVSDGGAEIRKRLTLFFHRSGETIETAEAFQFLRVVEACSVERPAEDGNGLIIRFERYRKWVAVLAAMCE
jgi:hypothetical protein